MGPFLKLDGAGTAWVLREFFLWSSNRRFEEEDGCAVLHPVPQQGRARPQISVSGT
ncbi:hypothetical protein SAMN05444170_7036 [Bradyrhizobium erythrophlei]|uniref:Uncharacterized protein n=1 Tax=Bradyrhizobium erythrophlei TaxID=1437360 RepID=A0A1M7UW06_9BRAD|nr:hypothetical protein SAMN05444170_7036 [Bradyrhizobium erythrophlei]